MLPSHRSILDARAGILDLRVFAVTKRIHRVMWLVLGTALMLPGEALARTMRLTHAFTYYSSQARTIRGELRLCDTDHRHFTLRTLIVGLGRAPRGDIVQVE